MQGSMQKCLLRLLFEKSKSCALSISETCQNGASLKNISDLAISNV